MCLFVGTTPGHRTEEVNMSNLSEGVSAALQVTSQHAQKFFGLVKGGAGKLITNIKESSTKMKEKVARSV